MDELQVIKRDGTPQAFNQNKIILGLTNAGLEAGEARGIAERVEQWIPTVAVDNTIKSIDIRDKILEILREKDPTSANEFESFAKNRVTNS